jgi:hypothetical protein
MGLEEDKDELKKRELSEALWILKQALDKSIIDGNIEKRKKEYENK